MTFHVEERVEGINSRYSVYNRRVSGKKELLLIQQEEYDVIIARKLLHTPNIQDARL